MYLEHLSATDPELASAIGDELTRERNSIELIASELSLIHISEPTRR